MTGGGIIPSAGCNVRGGSRPRGINGVSPSRTHAASQLAETQASSLYWISRSSQSDGVADTATLVTKDSQFGGIEVE